MYHIHALQHTLSDVCGPYLIFSIFFATSISTRMPNVSVAVPFFIPILCYFNAVQGLQWILLRSGSNLSVQWCVSH